MNLKLHNNDAKFIAQIKEILIAQGWTPPEPIEEVGRFAGVPLLVNYDLEPDALVITVGRHHYAELLAGEPHSDRIVNQLKKAALAINSPIWIHK